MVVQLTPGQKCILELLQRKLLSTIQAYRELSLRSAEFERQYLDIDTGIASNNNNKTRDGGASKSDFNLNITILKQIKHIDHELSGLESKIGRISARQKRFTNEILNGNGNNTISKENYFKALGLITKDALDKINLKSGERRRRTTANPRFSHEAIQAKRALEHHSQPSSQQSTRNSSRIEERASRATSTNGRRGRDNLDSNNKPVNSKPATVNVNNNNSSSQQQQVASRITNGRSNGRDNNNSNRNAKTTSNTDKNHNQTNNNLLGGFVTSCLSEHDKQQLQKQFILLQEQIFGKINQITEKREFNGRLEEENNAIRKRGAHMMNLLNEFCQNRAKHARLSGAAGIQKSDLPLNLVKSGGKMAQFLGNLNSSNGKQELLEPGDLWLNLKCDESLEGIESSDNPCEN